MRYMVKRLTKLREVETLQRNGTFVVIERCVLANLDCARFESHEEALEMSKEHFDSYVFDNRHAPSSKGNKTLTLYGLTAPLFHGLKKDIGADTQCRVTLPNGEIGIVKCLMGMEAAWDGLVAVDYDGQALRAVDADVYMLSWRYGLAPHFVIGRKLLAWMAP